MVNAIESKPKTKRIRYPKPKVPVVNEKAVAVALDAMKQARWLTLKSGSSKRSSRTQEQVSVLRLGCLPGIQGSLVRFGSITKLGSDL